MGLSFGEIFLLAILVGIPLVLLVGVGACWLGFRKKKPTSSTATGEYKY